MHKNMHTQTYTHVYKCIHIHIHTHMHIYTYVHVHTHTHIHIYKHTHTKCTYARMQAHLNDGAAATAREARLDAKKLSTSAPRENSNLEGGRPPQRESGLNHSRRTTGKHRTTTTDSSSSHHQDSAPSRPHPLICTGAEPIHPVHGPPKLPAWLWSPETRSYFWHFGA